MPHSDESTDVILQEALRFSNRQERDHWLVAACGGDNEKLRELRSLILASEKTVFLDTPLEAVEHGQRLLQSLEGICVGPFELIRQIGRGGMGAVYLAQQSAPVKRMVAVKLIQQSRESRQILSRFKSEQQILATMDHPNIARIIDAGSTPAGFHYIAMEYVHGQMLLDYCRDQRIDIRGKVSLMLQCCRAIQHAHQKGIIHRDIKPSNVMVSTVDGKPVVKVIDFGIAKALRVDASETFDDNSNPLGPILDKRHTTADLFPGTLRFMSPEQYASSTNQIDTRVDIYSSGALLYNMLTGFAPFDHVPLEQLSHHEKRQLISTSDPIAPSERNTSIAGQLRGDLDAIVAKAMHRDPEMRYSSMGQLHEDLEAYLQDALVQANSKDRWNHWRKFTKRNKKQLLAGTLAIVGLLVGLVISIIQREYANRSERLAQQRAYASDILLASMAISRNDYSLPRELLARHAAKEQRIDWRFLSSQMPEDPLTLARFNSKIYFAVGIPKSAELACGCKDSHLRVISQKDGSVRLDIDTKQVEINGLALNPDCKTIASAGDDGTVKFWDLESGELVHEFRVSQGKVFQIAWTTDGKYLVTVGNDPNALIWSVPDFKLIRTISSAEETLECLHMNRQGQVAFGSQAGVLRIVSVAESTDSAVQQVSVSLSRIQNVNRCSAIAFSASGDLLAIGQENGYLVLLKRSGQEYRIVERIRFPTSVTAVAFHSNESRIALGEDSGAVHMMSLPQDWPTRSRLRFTKSLLFENANKFSDIDADPSIVWKHVKRVEPSEAVRDLEMDIDRVYIEFDQTFKRILLAENFVREWMDDSGRSRPEWSEIPMSVNYKGEGIDLKFENRHSGWSDVKDLRARGRLQSWSSHSKRVSSLQWNEESKVIYSVSEDGMVKSLRADIARIAKIGGGGVSGFLPLHNQSLAIQSTDGQAFVTTAEPSNGQTAKDRRFPEMVCQVPGLFTPDGQWIYYGTRSDGQAGGFPQAIHRWDPSTEIVEKMIDVPRDLKIVANLGSIDQDRLVLEQKHHDPTKPTVSDVEEREQLSQLICWDLRLKRKLWETPPKSDTYHLAKLSPDGRYSSYVLEREVYLLDTKNGHEQILGRFPELHISSTRFSSDGEYLVVAVSNQELVCYRTRDGEQAWIIRAPGSPVSDLVWSKDGATLVCVTQDGFLRIFDPHLRQMTLEYALPLRDPIRVRLSPEEKWLYILDRDGTLVRLPCSGLGS
jgi:serine/threonine protein kinase/WD40 repeat protein